MYKMVLTPQSLQQRRTEQEGTPVSSGTASVPKDLLDKRMNPKRYYIKRHKTNIPSLDKHLGGGLPSGLSVIWGAPGSGKTLQAKQIAINQTGRVLYYACEILDDAPSKDKYPHVDTMDYTQMRPRFDKAVEHLFSAIQYYDPALIVVDSLTSFLGVTNKAISEASIRDAVWSIHLRASNTCPIIGISEQRGVGYNRTTAGGEGAKHGCTMLIQTYKHFLTSERYASSFPNHKVGDVVYTMEVEKDKYGMANPRPVEVEYLNDEQYYIKNRFNDG